MNFSSLIIWGCPMSENKHIWCLDRSVMLFLMEHKRIWMFGLQGTGKTTISDRIAFLLNCHVLHIGEQCRRRFGEGKMAGMDSPAAPMIADNFVAELVTQEVNLSRGHYGPWVEKFPGCSRQLAVIETFPKTLRQLWVMPKPDHYDLVLNVRCSESTAFERVSKTRSPEAMELFHAALEQSREEMPKVLEQLMLRGFKVLTIVNEG